MIKNNYKATILASFLGYITQAIMLNFPPLLFFMFHTEMGLSNSELSVLITCNFVTELIVDALASKFADKIGYRRLVIAADTFAIIGLISIPLLSTHISNPFLGLCISMAFCGIGGGLMEVLISPIVEACPTKNKSGMMSLLHSFYCWGQVGVVLITTIFFKIFSIDSWETVAICWAIIPFIDLVLFLFAPITALGEGESGSTLKSLLKSKYIWLLFIMMICAGATELSMAQWASMFAQSALGVSKEIGDLLGPCLFAVCMGSARVFYARMSEKIVPQRAIFISSFICIGAYLLAILAPGNMPYLSLLGCALVGVGAGVLWPCAFSLAAKKEPHGGVLMFGILALMGDFGCLSGPAIAGFVSNAFSGNLRIGFVSTLVFPLALAIICMLFTKSKKKQ